MHARSQGSRGTNCRAPCGWGCALRARGWVAGRAKCGVKEERFGNLESAAMQAAHVCVSINLAAVSRSSLSSFAAVRIITATELSLNDMKLILKSGKPT